jgi:flagellar motility protein MotE (MotC chaperone)
VSQSQRPGRAFAALSGLLLVTGLALLAATVARLPAIAALWAERDVRDAAVLPSSADWPPVSAIEPGNGPEPTPPAAQPLPPGVLPAAPGGDTQPATIATLEAMSAELGRHRAALAERERRLVLREAVMASVETRIGEQLARLDGLKGELERLTGALEAEEQAKITQLVKVYEAMKAKNAAAIFDPMALDLLLPIVRGMRETKVAAIVAEMDPAKARALTAELARKREPPPSP